MSHTFTPKIFVGVPKCPRFVLYDMGHQNINVETLTKYPFCYDAQLLSADSETGLISENAVGCLDTAQLNEISFR